MLDVAERILWMWYCFAFCTERDRAAFVARLEGEVAPLCATADERARLQLCCAMAHQQAWYSEPTADGRTALAAACLRHCEAGLRHEPRLGAEAKRAGTASMLHGFAAEALLRLRRLPEAQAALQRAAAAPKAKEGPGKVVQFFLPQLKRRLLSAR